MRLALLAALLTATGCHHAVPDGTGPAAPGATPTVVAQPGALHAVRCGAVTAVWLGQAPDLEGAPRSYGVTSLGFVFEGDATPVPFNPTGELAFNDWSFDVFSPDCSHVALLQDRAGPYHVLTLGGLRGYLTGAVEPTVVQATDAGGTARIHGDATWKSGHVLEFYASCCGTTDVFRADVGSGVKLEKVYSAETTGTLVRNGDTWEVRQ